MISVGHALRVRLQKLFLGFDCDQPMLRLPFLIRILPMGRVEEEVIVSGSLLVVAKVVQGGSAQKIGERYLRQKFRARIQSLDSQCIISVLARGKGQVAVAFTQIGFEFYGRKEFFLSLGKFLLPQQRSAQAVVKAGIVRMCCEQSTI